MDQPGPSGSGEPNIAVAVNQEQTADILKMDIDCCEEAFDYLPLEDLVSVGKTCKRLEQVAGHCFQQNYSAEPVHISKEGVYTYINGKNYNVQHFAPFIEGIWTVGGLRYFVDVQSQFRRLKQIRLHLLNSTNIDCVKKISMGKLEVLVLGTHNLELSDDIYEIINKCTKLRRLDIRCKGTSNWLNRKYPTLERFRFHPQTDSAIEGIPAFLELNTNIRKFATYAEFLLQYRDAMMAANIKLDDLSIYANKDESEFKSICDLLDELHASGFYKKLKLRIYKKIDQEDIDRLASLNGLSRLLLDTVGTSSLTFSALNNLEELIIGGSNYIADIDNLPNALINLKRIRFARDSIDSIMPFIRRSVEMQEISINFILPGVYFNRETRIIDLPALNRERALLTPEQVDGVQKVTLYVIEQVYLATKWAFGETDFGLVRLKRRGLQCHY